MLSLVACYHVDRLLHNVEVVLVVTTCGAEVEVPIDERLAAGIEKGIDIRLIPSALFYRLKLAIQIVKPLPNISLIRF
jgi:hypothetical protein